MTGRMLVVNDRMQQGYGYRYVLTEPVGCNFDLGFTSELTPKEMPATWRVLRQISN